MVIVMAMRDQRHANVGKPNEQPYCQAGVDVGPSNDSAKIT